MNSTGLFVTAVPKFPVTVMLEFIDTVQVPVPLQPPPLQPAKVESAAGVAVSVTEVPMLWTPEQFAPQSIPAGLLVTVPLPVPDVFTVRVKFEMLNVAVQVILAFIVTTPSEQSAAPLQPAKVEFVAAVAVSVTEVSGA